jgi:hypothetical protein
MRHAGFLARNSWRAWLPRQTSDPSQISDPASNPAFPVRAFPLPAMSRRSRLPLPRSCSQNLLKHRRLGWRHLLDSSSPSKMICCKIGIPSAYCCAIWLLCHLWVVVDASPVESQCPSLQRFVDRHLLAEGLFVALVSVAACSSS